jgi:ribosomal protein S18 acetylase RimI-like enzyme
MNDRPCFRRAEPTDSRFIAQMLEMSSDGVALIEWSDTARGSNGCSPLDIGAQMYASGEGDYSYRNCRLAEVDGGQAGLLLSFAMTPEPASEPAPPPPYDGSDVFAPYRYLEAPDTWYVCGIAVVPRFRRRGLGAALMELARQQALDHGYQRLSLVVFEQNQHAVRLYQRLGYQTIKRAPIVPHPLIRCRGDALLMVADA